MDNLSSFNDFFDEDEIDEETFEDVLQKRKETKEKFAKQLREKCFMNTDELNQVMEIIDDYFKKNDNYQKKFNYKKYDIKADRKFESGLIKLRYDFNCALKSKINEIMKIKLEKAKNINQK